VSGGRPVPDFSGRIRRHLQVLAEDIGPRGSGTEAEARAAAYVEAQLRAVLPRVWSEDFKTPGAYAWAYLVIYGLALVGALALVAAAAAAPFASGRGLAAAALVLGVGAVVVLLRENTTAGTLGGWFRQYPSRNVIGVLPPAEAEPGTAAPVVLSAHVDSAKWGLMFDPKGVHRFRALFLGGVASMALVPVLGLAIWLTGRAVLGWIAVVPAAWLLVSMALLVHREVVGTYTPGANDNASGVAAMLALAEYFAERPPRRVPLWFVATGAEEVGLVGMLDFLRRHGHELRDAAFFIFDNIGSGHPKYAVTEGMIRSYRLDSGLIDLAARIAAAHPEWGVRPARNDLMSTDALPAVRQGFRTIAFRAEDDRGLLPNWHWPTDTLDRVDVDVINTVARLAEAMIREMDGG